MRGVASMVVIHEFTCWENMAAVIDVTTIKNIENS